MVALITAGLTAFYMFRAIFMTFGGEYKGGEPAERTAPHLTNTTSTLTRRTSRRSAMALPLLILAIPAALAGFANISHDVERLLLGRAARRRRSRSSPSST